MKNIAPERPSLAEFVSQIPTGNIVWLAQAITLVESSRAEAQRLADDLIEHLLPLTGKSIRIGITGVPGVGKSTFIETFGKVLTTQSKKIAVLAIDPTSSKTKGSILGDKTRMEELSKEPLAFIRPTATRLALGGVADRTREAVLLCEAAGFEIIIIETVGVGQSETAVRSMVDFFLLLMLAGAGDELQGIKKGIMEMADGIVITKADGENVKRADRARLDFQQALQLFSASESGWQPKVLTSSATEKKGIKEVWELMESYLAFTHANGFFKTNRQEQNLIWFREHMQHLLRYELEGAPHLKNTIHTVEHEIINGNLLPSRAAQKVIQEFLNR